MHQSILVYRNLRYLKWATALTVLALVAYIAHQPGGVPNGGTWLGYTLGTIGAVLILWLTWFGIRKRRYGPGRVKLEDWLSAHVYLSLSLIIVATLHTGFQFGINVHTLAYGLMIAVIASGAFGVYAYIRYPRLMTENRRGETLQQMMAKLADLDRESREAAVRLPDAYANAVMRASEGLRLGGSVWTQLKGGPKRDATDVALEEITTRARGDQGADSAALHRLLTLMTQKRELLARARKDIQFKAVMDIWLYVHVPLTLGLLAALTAHIVSVFFYW